jgi:cytochrome c oxidase assembly factor CtaG
MPNFVTSSRFIPFSYNNNICPSQAATWTYLNVWKWNTHTRCDLQWRYQQTSLMFVPCILDVVEMTNNMHWLYHCFILYTGSYIFRQWPAIIRELLRSFRVTWNTNRMGGVSYNAWLRELCAGLSWFPREPRQYTTHSICISGNSERSKKLPDDSRLLLKHVGASI